jgi:deazaflavin-dependent oxidoreductase (nitroreductase family)
VDHVEQARVGCAAPHHLGRKSGQERSVIIGYLEHGPNLVALAMNGWDEGHPSWWLNLEARPDAVVRLTRQHPPWWSSNHATEPPDTRR